MEEMDDSYLLNISGGWPLVDYCTLMEASDLWKGILFYLFSGRMWPLVSLSKWRLLIGWKEFCFNFYLFSGRRWPLVSLSKWRLLIGWKEFCFTFALKRGGNWLVGWLVYPNGGFWLVGVPKWRLLIGWCIQIEASHWLILFYLFSCRRQAGRQNRMEWRLKVKYDSKYILPHMQ